MQYWGVVLGLLVAGCGSSAKKQGELNADCYPNGTCNVTLACVGGICVAEPVDAGRDGSNSNGHDAATDAPTDAPRDAAVDARSDAHRDAPPDAYCYDLSSNIPAAHHDAGTTCITAGCHLAGNTGAGAPAFSYAGTLYHDAQGTTPYAGATVEIIIGGFKHTVVTSTDGNFYITSALANPPTNAMTATALVSVCPSLMSMQGALVDNGGNCNNCHRTGGTTPPLYLP